MSKNVYIVITKSIEHNEELYLFGASLGAEMVYESRISRATHYALTDDQVNAIKALSIVEAVIPRKDKEFLCSKPLSVNNTGYTVSGDFSKLSSYTATDYQWGMLHTAGTDAQRRKGIWGYGATPLSTVTDSIDIFNNGAHVDVVIMDNCLSYDLDEWLSPSTGLSRFVQYQWFDELSAYLGYGAPTGTVTYHVNASNPNGHGNHVGATVAGQHYGWAKEANIYSIPAPYDAFENGRTISDYLVFDMVAAFHQYKPINPVTGRRNPTIVNMSWAYFYDAYIAAGYPSGWTFSDLTSVIYDGVTYDSNNPGPSGWTEIGVEVDFGISPSKQYVFNDQSIGYEVQGMIDAGCLAIAGAANYNNEAVNPGHVGFNDYFILGNNARQVYYRQGASPGANDRCIYVGAIGDYSDFRRANYSTFGERIDTFAPGTGILSAWDSSGIPDTKYGGDNYYVSGSGTSYASPQVSGIAALLASTRYWMSQKDLIGYIKNKGKRDDMTFDAVPGGAATGTYAMNVIADLGGADWTVSGPDATTYIYGNDPTITFYEGDTLTLEHQARSHYISMNNPIGTSDWDMSWYDADSGQTNGSDIPITIDEGEAFTMEMAYSGGGHPLYIRSILGDPSSNVTQVLGQGAEQQGEAVTWETQIGDAGTYYYQCANHPSMYGTITINPAGTSYNHPLYIKTVNGVGTANQLPGVTNQGSNCRANGALTVTLPAGAGLYYYTHGTNANMWGIIQVLTFTGAIGQTGNYADPTCSKGSPNSYPLCANPRNLTGYIDDATYNIRETTGVQYPRRKIMFKQ
jgi:hypothetical protein